LIKYISTLDQIADIFTKGLSTARFTFLKSKLLVDSPPISLRETVSESPPTINSTSSSVSKDSNSTCNSSSCMTLQADQLTNINNIPQDTVINKLPGKIVSSDNGTYLNSILEKG
jgi:hypothetical protein